MTNAERIAITVEDLMALEAQGRFEVVNGELVEIDPMAASTLHVFTGKRVMGLLDDFVEPRQLGYVLPDGLTYILHEDQHGVRTARLPDVSFLRRGRITRDTDLTRPFFGAPDLAIEIVSPSETADELQSKIDDYLLYGTAQVWVFYPTTKQVHQHRAGEDVFRKVRGDQRIDAEAILPGLQLSVAECFVLPDFED